MNVVIEGPDGGGKSSLAEVIHRIFPSLRVQQGSGPPRGPGEIEARLAYYLTLSGVLFDRHPAVSQPIYASLRGEDLSPEFTSLVDRFYDAGNCIFVYCRSTTPARHQVKSGESASHVETLTRRYDELVSAYDRWSVARAHLLFRIGDDPLDVARVVAGAMAGL